MSCIQNKFVLGDGDKWWAPPIDPRDEVDYYINFAELLDGDEIEEVIEVVVTQATFVSSDPVVGLACTGQHVIVWLREATLSKKPVTVSTTIRSAGGRTFNRTFYIEVLDL